MDYEDPGPPPVKPPTCEHGSVPVRCRKCHEQDSRVYAAIRPLVDEYWAGQGKADLVHLFKRAYHMGMKHVKE